MNNKTELAWIERLQKTLNAAPSSYTIVDDSLTLFNEEKYKQYLSDNNIDVNNDNREVGAIVEQSGSEIATFYFPFSVEGIAG